MPATKYEGVAVTLGGQEWILPALSLGFIRRNGALLEAFSAAASASEAAGHMCDIAHAALVRNYPDLTLEQVEEMLDMPSAQRVFVALKEVSGLVSSGGATPAPQ
jgi:hypothetical protein